MGVTMTGYSYTLYESVGTPLWVSPNGGFLGTKFLDIAGSVTLFDGSNPSYFLSNLNSSGTVIGVYRYPYAHYLFGFSSTNGDFTVISPTGAKYNSYPTAISETGEIVGYFAPNTSHENGFSYLNGIYSFFDPPNASFTYPTAVNSYGDIAGSYVDATTNQTRGFLDHNGTILTFDVSGAVNGPSVKALNNSDEIVGTYSDGTTLHGFINKNGVITTLDVIDARFTNILGLNNFGEIVGYYIDQSGKGHGFTYVNGVIANFDMPDSIDTHIGNVNDYGMVSGFYTDTQNIEHYFTATPLTPIAADDRSHIDANHGLKIGECRGVLSNDTNTISNDKLFVVAVDGSMNSVGTLLQGHYGSLTLQSDGSYAYKAANQQSLPHDSVGVDSFIYTASNSEGGTSTASLTIVVTHNDQKYYGGQANTVINGPNLQHTVLDGGAGGDIVNAGNKGAVLIGGHDDILKGGNGSDIFVFSGQFGSNTVKNFDANHDLMQFDRSFYLSIADVQSHAHQVGADTVIDGLGTNDVTLTGVKLASLHFDTSHMLLV